MKTNIPNIYRQAPNLEIPPLVFFDTKKQQSRLGVDAQGCFIELENKEAKNIKKYRVQGRAIEVKESDRDYKDRIGLVDIGDRKNWLYSKRLFLDQEDLKEQINLRLMNQGLP